MNQLDFQDAVQTIPTRFKDRGLRPFYESIFYRPEEPSGLQRVHTPLSLCMDMLTQLRLYVDLKKSQIAVLCNPEFVDILINDLNVPSENITFIADSDMKMFAVKEMFKTNVLGLITWKEKKLIMPKVAKKFDVVVMNPPYQAPQLGKNTHKLGSQSTLWDKFVIKSHELCKPGGFIAAVHPANWRRPEHEIWSPISSKDVRFLSIHSAEEGNKLFGASTRFDWYVLCNAPNKGATIVHDEKRTKIDIKLSDWPFLPNFNYDIIRSILAKGKEEKCPLLFDTIYHGQKEYVSKEQTTKFKYPCVYSMTQEGVGYLYSSKDLGHFGIPKIIISIGRYPYAFNDFEGKYGMTQAAFAIKIDSKTEGDNLVRAINSEKFGEVIKAIRCNTFNIEYRMFRQFRRDFWKDFA